MPTSYVGRWPGKFGSALLAMTSSGTPDGSTSDTTSPPSSTEGKSSSKPPKKKREWRQRVKKLAWKALEIALLRRIGGR